MRNKTLRIIALSLIAQISFALTTVTVNPGQSIDIDAGDNLRVQCSGNNSAPLPAEIAICICSGQTLYLKRVKIEDGTARWSAIHDYGSNSLCTQATETLSICKN